MLINEIDISAKECFNPEEKSIRLGTYTFIYGPNGTGKSTVSRSVEEQAPEGTEVHIYNQDYVRLLIENSEKIEGVITLLDGDQATVDRVRELEDANGPLAAAQRNLYSFESKKKIEEAKVQKSYDSLIDGLWREQKNLPESLRVLAFAGLRSNREKFCNEALRRDSELPADDLTPPPTFDELEKRLASLTPEEAPQLKPLPAAPPTFKISDEIKKTLKHTYSTESDDQLMVMINKLDSLDWVEQGRQFLEEDTKDCPFCQQQLPEEIKRRIVGLFTSEYTDAKERLSRFVEELDREVAKLQRYRDNLESAPRDLVESVLATTDRLRTHYLEIGKAARDKIADMSMSAVIADETLPEIGVDVEIANKRIQTLIDERSNAERTRSEIAQSVWKTFLTTAALRHIVQYQAEINGPQKGIEALTAKIGQAQSKTKELSNELDRLKDRLSGTKQVVTSLNSSLKSLGFSSFELRSHGDDEEYYQIVRPDNTIAGTTLSEGEKTLTTFLYFYHRLRSRASDPTIKTIAVIDDPISSLDSQTLFAISLLCREILELCRDESSNLTQIVLSSHNAYFFKEVAFLRRGESAPQGREFITFGKGPDGLTNVKSHGDENPISSLYDSLWSDIREARNRSSFSPSIQNSMRRIIESYFNAVGGLSANTFDTLPPERALVFKSLLAWINDGSHMTPWDSDYSPVAEDGALYFSAFEDVFKLTGHAAHYEMMMNQNAPSTLHIK